MNWIDYLKSQQTFSAKNHTVNFLSFVDHMDFVTTAPQLGPKAAVDSTYTNGYGYRPINLNLQREATGQM